MVADIMGTSHQNNDFYENISMVTQRLHSFKEDYKMRTHFVPDFPNVVKDYQRTLDSENGECVEHELVAERSTIVTNQPFDEIVEFDDGHQMDEKQRLIVSNYGYKMVCFFYFKECMNLARYLFMNSQDSPYLLKTVYDE